MKKTFIYSATKGAACDTLLYESVKQLDILDSCYFREHNKKPIAERYNEVIKFAEKEKIDYLVLCHDDISIESSDLFDRIERNMKDFDVLGVAGTKTCTIQEPALWHLMGGGFGGGNLSGAVGHSVGATQKHVTGFGPYPQRVVLLDGVFLVLSKKAFKKVKFDESCPSGFHFYDLSYSLDCCKQGLKLGVSDILITHASPGLTSLEDKEWNEGQKWFLEKYKDLKGRKVEF